ncbi:MAG: bifunctional (p)ppGpp synthetase/guanosine-3',5'-bis(diphosphate) 3'-pyrophosphohydrolase [Ignavibacteriales bacterium]|nr:bifunctional (p)ppGpp synthetase/guanosine-3',5'-bis(diphosphate) 3'-pyrophosphohydrolase [Ignavibacteriales bacterium]MCB9209959.1 bifunctional (p)ppGpp synthetase/guanosine-3',5'-bis(diphosphate) 3'-pyrophosphohydrolase [Ignavibacteriales bacterium]MCB9218656.1 bifunctional (p)ppGpp synthetase/guanosine-3',5'-bis(diphosphate) 3'-pyrophosphohydrolase [Ignavibacteriales bacterium]MCB9259338.1 bifunctional (p)ppGpp synthetase/guanosine-3',5'-bis(diphosphate) 3'-pyrophosphohydrolase [Ignavibact
MELTEEKLDEMLKDLLNLCRTNLPNVNEDLIIKGFKLSLEAHKNHFRASGDPYFLHPYQVTMIVAKEIPLDDISVVSALLHDVVEDTDISLEFIEKEFGKEIAEIVDGVTKIGGVFMGQSITQAENYRKLLLSMVNDVRVILVKFADRLHNMRTLEFVSQHKQRRIATETLEIYAPFANRFGLAKVKWELEDLAFKYLNKEAYNEISKKLKETRREREDYIKNITAPIRERLDEHELSYEIGGRPKHFYSIYKKMIKQNKPLEDIYDLSAIRIILESNDPNECYYVLGIINQLFKPIPDRFKDFISIPKRNNYQSIHNTVIGPNGKLVEIQIRTRQMHEIAEKGVAAHWKYKENMDSSNTDLEDWVNLIRDIFESASKDEASNEILQSFKLNLYQDEIYVFTPKGDLKILPIDSTPVDFAYEIHSKVGYHCIGAKVNGKIVPLSSPITSGDQVEILTSKNQHPNKSWLQFVQTHKAKSNIRKYIQKEEDRIVETGKEIWERKLKKYKLIFTSDDINKLVSKLKFENQAKFFVAVAEDRIDLESILNPVELKEDDIHELEFDNFAKYARDSVGEVVVEGEHKGFVYSYAKCCNPIPGDPIVGYITIGEGIKIHRKNCKNLLSLSENSESRLVPVEWPGEKGSFFLAGISIKGEDRPGILKDISNSIAGFNNTNIKSVNISTTDSIFNGHITVYIQDVMNLNKLIDRLKKNKGVFSVERFDAHN